MDIIRDQLNSMVCNLKKMHRNYNKELAACPSGRLINNSIRKRPSFFHAEPLPDHKYKRKYLKNGDPLINALARKEYLSKSIPLMENNIRLLENVLQKYSSLDPADIIRSMKRAYRILDSQSFFCNEAKDLYDVITDIELLTDESIRFRCDLHREWANEEYTKNSYPFPDEKHLTGSGTRVRSRGEIIISDRLDFFGVPFRYDQLIYLNDGNSISPDFTFEDKHFDEFYLEYCGSMDDVDYVRQHIIKRNRYEANGIVPWKNIYFLYSNDSGISVPEIDSIIRNYVLPRL